MQQSLSFIILHRVFNHYIVLPSPSNRKTILYMQNTKPLSFVFEPFSFVTLFLTLPDPETMLLTIYQLTLVVTSIILSSLTVKFALADFKFFPFLENSLLSRSVVEDSVLLPVIALQDAFVLP